MTDKLEVKNLTVSSKDKKILDKVSFEIAKGEVVVLMGPNGAGKSTISHSILGNPKYDISGKVILDGEDLSDLSTEERAKRGLFMSFQQPTEIDGVTFTNFLRTSYNILKNTNISLGDFHKLLKEKMKELDLDSKFRTRSVNSHFSGGEKKKSEVLQLVLFEPKYAVLDEIDSGVDVDSLKIVAEAIKEVAEKNKIGLLLITHHSRILDFIKPSKVLILKDGKIVEEGDSKIVKRIEEKGFN